MAKVLRGLLLVLSALTVTTSSPTRSRSHYALKNTHPVPRGWKEVSRARTDERIRLHIGLRHGRFDELVSHLDEISDPFHPRYGKHLTASEVAELVQPSQTTIDLVQEWLGDHQVLDFDSSPTRDWLSIDIEIQAAEKLLQAEYYSFRQQDDGATVTRCRNWSLPLHLHDHIDAIQPTNAFFRTQRQPGSRGLSKRGFAGEPLGLGENGLPTYEELAKIDITEMGHMDVPDAKDMPPNPTPDQACNRLATSSLCLRALYGTLGYTPQAPEKVRVALVNYLSQVSNRSDVEIFLQRYRPEAAAAAREFRSEIVAHGSDRQTVITEEEVKAALTVIGLEGNLNAETLLGLGYPIPLTVYNVGGDAPFQKSLFSTVNKNEPYLEWLQYILAQPSLPQVITTSYADEEQSVPYWYAKRVCQGFAQLGARGVSVLFASGDEGVGKDGKCFSNDGSKRPMFLPTFPASCPYVTAVGGTRHWEPEMVGFDARSSFVSGGGFSNYFTRPRYQNRVVAEYLDSIGGLHDGLYNRTGRGYPDISMRAYHYITIWNGTAHIVDGTSASSPAAAAIFALLNDALAAQGKPALGWLNPWIYSKAHMGFKDVTVGSNMGCNTPGFPAKKGWDPGSGFGTPWFPKLRLLAEGRQYRGARPWYMAAEE